MKSSKYEKWAERYVNSPKWDKTVHMKEAWNASLIKVISLIRYRNKCFEGNWQHEDIEMLIDDIKDMVEK